MSSMRAVWLVGVVSLVFLVASDTVSVDEDVDDDESTETEDVQATKRRPLRPSLTISDRILPIQLVDVPDGSFQIPRRKQLRVQMLTAALGNDLDPFWMSVEKPAVSTEEPLATSPSDRLVSQLRALNLGGEMEADLDNVTLRALEDFLLRKASCPVRYVWDDVGPLFWPRWIKRGECVDDPQRRPCSWPAGMHCVPAESVTFHLLRWHCRPRTRRASSQAPFVPEKTSARLHQRHHDHRQFRCQWLKVPYPVTARCFCSC